MVKMPLMSDAHMLLVSTFSGASEPRRQKGGKVLSSSDHFQ